jgi:endonuclease/exonuclease/phosphatase family metal-dependent hydrolase
VFVNTHWDHQGVVARRESGKLIRARLAELAGDAPVVLTGDLNADEKSDGVAALTTSERPETRLLDSYRAAHPERAADEATFNGFAGRTKGARIDFILHTPQLKTLEAAIDRTHAAGKYPSDHYPVTAVLAWDGGAVP